MADISKITPLNSATTYDIKALSLKSQGRVTTADFDAWDDAYRSKITTMLASSSMDSSGTKPPCGDGYLINFGWDTTAGWGAQLAVQHTSTPRVCVRGCNGGEQTSTWGNWYWLPTAASAGVGGATTPVYINSSGQVTAGTAIGASAYHADTYFVKRAGDTMTGQLYINFEQDVGVNQNGSLVIGNKAGENIGFDSNEIMARNNSANSTLYLNSEGGQVYIGSGGVNSVGTVASTAGYLKSTCNSNTVSIGSQNTSYCHIESSANIPFWFNRTILIQKGCTIGQAGSQYRPFQIYLGRNSTAASNAINAANPLIEFANGERSQYGQLIYTDYDSVRAPDGLTWVGNQANSWFQAPRIFGAVWNDYAEYRETKEEIEPGRCIVETGNGDLILSTERLQGGCEIVSDTYGFAIGETATCKTPTACAGRVLAYLYEDNSLAKPGDPVCSGPNGTVSLMTHEEEKEWPSRIIGTVSEVPNYEEWEYGSADEHGVKNKLKVNGRIWIRIR